jgi:hypothetical protein
MADDTRLERVPVPPEMVVGVQREQIHQHQLTIAELVRQLEHVTYQLQLSCEGRGFDQRDAALLLARTDAARAAAERMSECRRKRLRLVIDALRALVDVIDAPDYGPIHGAHTDLFERAMRESRELLAHIATAPDL